MGQILLLFKNKSKLFFSPFTVTFTGSGVRMYMSLGGHFQPPHGPAAKIKETLGCILNEIENHWKVSNDMSCLVFLKRLLCCRDSVEKQDGSAVFPKVHLWK